MHSRPALVVALLMFAACAPGRRPASYLPVGAPAQYGDQTADGVVLLLRGTEASVRAAVVGAFVANGYVVDSVASAGRLVTSAARRLGGDTSLVVRAEMVPEDPSGGGVAVVVSGEYSVPSAGIRRARVIQRPGERHPLYARLGAVGDSTRRFFVPAP